MREYLMIFATCLLPYGRSTGSVDSNIKGDISIRSHIS